MTQHRERWALILLAHALASYACLITAVLVFEPRKMLGGYLLPVLAAPASVPVTLVIVTMAATVKGKMVCWVAYAVSFAAVLVVRRRSGTVGAYRVWTAAAVVVAAVVVGLVVSGVRSFRSGGFAAIDAGRFFVYLQSVRGGVMMSVGIADRSYGFGGGADETPLAVVDRSSQRVASIVDEKFSVLGFALHTGDPSRRYPNGLWVPVRVAAPHWFFVLVMLGIGWWILRQRGKWLRRERKERGLCEACGYDLRESRERCPECGKDVLARLWFLVVARVNRLLGGQT